MASGMLLAPAAGRSRRTGGPSSPLVQQMLDHQAAQIEHLVSSELAALAPILEQARKSLAADLVKAWGDKAGDQTFEKQHLSNALVMVDAAMKKMRNVRGGDPLAGSLDQVLRAAGGSAAGMSAKHLNEQLARFSEWFEGTIHPVQVQEAAIVALGAKSFMPRYATSAARYSANVQNDIRQQIAIGFLRNETFDQMTARLVARGGPRGLVALRGIAGTPGAKVELITEGLFKRYRFWAERIVRTEAIGAYNEVHQRGLEEVVEDDPDIRKRWDAAADWRVCPICAGLDGQITDVGGVFVGGYKYAPAHAQCRCTIVPWKVAWEKGYAGHPIQQAQVDQAGGPTPVDPRRRDLYQVPDVPQRAPGELPGRLPGVEPAAPPALPPPPKPIPLSEPEAAQVLGPPLKPHVEAAHKAAADAEGAIKAELEKFAARLAVLEKHQAELAAAALTPKKTAAIVAKGKALQEKQAAKDAAAAAKAQAKEDAKKAAQEAKDKAKAEAATAKAQANAMKSFPAEAKIEIHVPSDFEALAIAEANKKGIGLDKLSPADLWKSLDAKGMSVTPSEAVAYLKQLKADEAHSSALTKWSIEHGHLFPATQAHPVIQEMNAKAEAKAALAAAAAEKAKQEAEAKAAAELKAKKEAIAQKSAETKAKNKAAKEAAAKAEIAAAAAKVAPPIPLGPQPTSQIKGWQWHPVGNKWVLVDAVSGKSADELAAASHAVTKTLKPTYSLGAELAKEGLFPTGNGVMTGHGLKYEKIGGSWELTGKLGKDGGWNAVEKPVAPPKPVKAHGFELVDVQATPAYTGKASAKPQANAPELTAKQFAGMRATFEGDLKPLEKSAAMTYSGSAYRPMNTSLRVSKGAQAAVDYKETIQHLDRAIARTSMIQDTRLFRGAGGPEAVPYFRQFKPGDVFMEHGYTSTSYNYDASFKTSTRLEITVPKGGLAAAIPSHFKSEDEVLLPRGQKFRIDRIEERGGQTIVHVTAVYGDEHPIAPEKVSR